MAANIKKEADDKIPNDGEDDVESDSSSNSLNGADLYRAMYESIKDAAAADAKPNKQVQNIMKKRHQEKFEAVETRADMSPDRTTSDFYCNICDAHMNSEQMWESHVSGKRHLKNVNKEPGEMPSKLKAFKVATTAKLMDAIKNVHEPLVGLKYMTELQRADSCLKPSYTCHLCKANCTWSVVIEHILGTKHRLAYLKAVDSQEYQMIENMDLKKTSLDQLAEDRAREYEKKNGCGTMEVKLEKPKVAPPPPRRELSTGHRSRSSSSEINKMPPHKYRCPSPPQYRHKIHDSPMDGKWRHDRYSPEVQSPVPVRVRRTASSSRLPDITSLSTSEKISCLQQICKNLIPMSEPQVRKTKNIISDLSESVMQYKIRQLPVSLQDKLTKKLVRDEVKKFEDALYPTLEYLRDVVRCTSSASSHRSRRHRHRHHRCSSTCSSKKIY